MNALWNQLASRANVTLSEEQHRQLAGYLDLLASGNQKMNLTGITERESAEIAHIGDALTLLPFLRAERISIVDVGSGGGVPGIPLAIARPDTRVVLIEATKKKAGFLAETVR